MPSSAASHEFGQIGLEPQHDRLRLRIAEAHVEFDDFGRAVRVDHQSGVEEADERRAFGGHARERRFDDFAQDALLAPPA